MQENNIKRWKTICGFVFGEYQTAQYERKGIKKIADIMQALLGKLSVIRE